MLNRLWQKHWLRTPAWLARSTSSWQWHVMKAVAMRALAMLGVNATQLERQTARVMEEYQRMQEEIQKEEKKDELERAMS